ncbi:MAG TPA: hypothetical protein PLD10_15950 [Rhodopila sp.]|nr:hypothetical protein [Rhodopila sp.]
MKTIEAIHLFFALKQFQQTQPPQLPMSVKLAYAVERNLRTLQPIYEAYQAAADPMKFPIIAAFENARREYVLSQARKLEDGSPSILPNGDADLADRPAVEKHVAEMRAGYAGLAAEEEELSKRVSELNEQQEDIIVHTVNLKFFPEHMAPGLISGLFPMIVDD